MTRQQRIGILKEMLAASTADGNEKKAVDCIQRHLTGASIRCEKVKYTPGKSNLVAELGDDGPVLAFSGHLDDVLSGDVRLWMTPSAMPFPIEKSGRLYALGATDKKGALAAMVTAMAELAAENVRLPGRIRLLATVGEEAGLLGAEDLTKKGYVDDVESLIIGEPSAGRVLHAHMGSCTCTVISRCKYPTRSASGHSANAIDQLLLFYNKMMDAFSKLDEQNDLLGRFTYSTNIFQGGREYNVPAQRATLTTTLRTTPEVGNDRAVGILRDIIAQLNAASPQTQLELRVTQSDAPVFSDSRSKLVKTAQAQVYRMFDEPERASNAPGALDAAKYICGNKEMQIIVFGPGNDSVQKEEEYIELREYLEIIDLYKSIAKAYFEPQVASVPPVEHLA